MHAIYAEAADHFCMLNTYLSALKQMVTIIATRYLEIETRGRNSNEAARGVTFNATNKQINMPVSE